MPYRGEVVRAATEAMNAAAQDNRRQFEARRREIYRRCPRFQEIDRLLARTVREASLAALRHGEDPGPALERAKSQNLSLQQERRQLLAQNGCRQDALTYRPLCPVCQDRGWVGSQMCQCLRRRCGQEQIKALSSMLNLGNQSFDTFNLDYYSPVYDSSIGTSPLAQMEIVQDICFTFADRFGRADNVARNLFLTGAPGLGKTFLSVSIARVVSEKGYSVVYDSAINVFNQFDAQRFGRDPDGSAAQAVQRYLTCDLMILDDLGSESTSPMIQSYLYQLVNDRILNDRQTVISSNLSLDAVQRRYSPQVYSRLEGEYYALSFYGEDIRRQKKRQAGR